MDIQTQKSIMRNFRLRIDRLGLKKWCRTPSDIYKMHLLRQDKIVK
jgi:hypothetical protein